MGILVESGAEIAVGVVVELVLAAIVLSVCFLLFVRIFGGPKRGRVLPFQAGVILDGQRVIRTVGPGSHWIGLRRTLVVCDMRPKPFHIAGVECITGDGLAVRISLGGEYRVGDPAKFISESADAFGAFYLEMRHSLNNALSEMTSSGFLSGHPQIVARMKELLVPKSAHLGIELTQLDLLEAIPVGWLRPL